MPFLDTLRYQLTTRTEFERLIRVDPDTPTDLERAGRFLYLQRMAWGGKIAGRSFGVVIECLDWAEFVPRYDGADTLFYLDPPYYGSENDYGKAMFHRADFDRMADVLARIKGRFILSINNIPEMRAAFASFHLCGVQTTYSVANHAASRSVARGELLVSNFSFDWV